VTDQIILEKLPLVADQAGVWEGEYVHFDADHREIDRHRSRLVCRLIDGPDGEARLSQTNIYDWPDQTREIRFFEGVYRGDRVWIKNELIDGWTASINLDESGRTIMVAWVRPQDPGFRFYEMITLSEDLNAKNRTWHWYRDGQLFQRTLINERRVTKDWKAYDRPDYYRFQARSPRA